MRVCVRNGFIKADGGTAALEFALVSPLFLFLIIGIVVYGSWLWMAQGVQSLASEGARAAVAGLDPGERDELARDAVDDGLAGAGMLDPALTRVAVSSDARLIRVVVSYDAASHPLMAMATLVPPPPAHIERSAVVRIGGY